jgi:hypothetical protein
MSLLLAHPEIPTCGDCQSWYYDTKTWERKTQLARGPGGELTRKDVPRPRGSPTPCHTCPKSKNGQPNPAAELSRKNHLALQLYLEVKAGAPMPDDPIVRRNFAMIRWIEDARQSAQLNLGPMLVGMIGVAASIGAGAGSPKKRQ